MTRKPHCKNQFPARRWRSDMVDERRGGRRPFSSLALAVVVAGATTGACGVEPTPPPRSPSSLRLALGADESLRRAPVTMDHGKHTDALGADSCKECHAIVDDELSVRLVGTRGLTDPDALMSVFHRQCTDCHKARVASGQNSGPVTCGGCHVEGAPTTSSRHPMVWDYSMHGRHVAAAKDDCGACHHVYDETSKKLVYVKGKESACRDCHGPSDEGKQLSFANAAHVSCVGCHRQQTEDTGPVMCAGCHDAGVVASYARLDSPPRIERAQPQEVWLQADGARSHPVLFNHRNHEGQARICSECHHQTLDACDTCHTLTGSNKGQGVTLEQAYHHPTAGPSCVGCHERATEAVQCAGCHRFIEAGPHERTCTICHQEKVDHEIGVEDRPEPVVENREGESADTGLAPLPASSESFPERVKIDFLAGKYRESVLPHAAIVRKLHTAVQSSALAKRFHDSTETLCAGCHHHSPKGERPPSCRSCHGPEADPLNDKPALQAAYHRQCIGCHEEMKKPVGCTDCHAEAQP